MKRTAGILLVVVFAFWSGVFIFALLIQASPAPVADNLSRQAEPRVLFGAQQSQVMLNYTIPATNTCVTNPPQIDVLLVLDQSDSMGKNNALEKALNAARRFVSTIDLSVARLAIIFFSDQVIIGSGFSQDSAVLLNNLLSVSSFGSTNLDGALVAAYNLLQSQSESTTAKPMPTIIVLTDGRANDSAAALQTGQQLTDAGVHLIAVGLGEVDVDFLRDFVTEPDDLYLPGSPEDLERIYKTLATEINLSIGTNVMVTETVNAALSLVSGIVDLPDQARNNQLIWKTASLTPNGLSMQYAVTARSIGLHPVNEDTTMLTYLDCLAQPVALMLTAGPPLLAMPDVPWLIAFILLSLLLPTLLVLGGRFGRSKQHPSLPKDKPVESPTLPPTDLTPAWIRRLDQKKVLTLDRSYLAGDNLAPTVLIGIGPVGRYVLSQVGQQLRSRYGSTLPVHIRLLQIDVQDRGSSDSFLERPPFLTPEEWVLITPDLKQIGESIQRFPRDWPHLDWYNAAQPDLERARGRMALFYDLKDGNDNSLLWSGLSMAVQGLLDPKVRIIGATFDDVSSGMLVDMIHLLHLIKGAAIDVELWLVGPVGEDWSERLHDPRRKVRTSEQIMRTLATLRELERFQRNARVPFRYVTSAHTQNQLYAEVNTAVVQTLFLFDKSHEKMSIEDHLTSVADCLLATLHLSTQQEITRLLTASRAFAFETVNRDQIGMVCTLNAYAVRAPDISLQRAVAWRIIYDLLFEQNVGLLPLAQLQEDGNYIEFDPEELPRNKETQQTEVEDFVKRYQRNLLGPEFRVALAYQISKLLNGEMSSGAPEMRRVGGLIQADRWLRMLGNDLRILEPEVGQLVSKLRLSIEEWQTFLTVSVHPLLKREIQLSRQEIQSLTTQSGRIWVTPSDQEWTIYRQTIRPRLELTTDSSGESLLRVAQRFGWHVSYDETERRWQVELLIPPGDYVWSEREDDLESFASPREAQSLLVMLQPYALALATSSQAGRYILEQATARISPRDWVDRIHPQRRRVGDAINDSEASRIMKGNISSAILLVAPTGEQSQPLHRSLQTAPGAGTVLLCETQDSSAVTLLFLRSYVPLHTHRNFTDMLWQEQLVPPGYYVWRGEQIASEYEPAGQRLKSEFVGWLQREPVLIELFAQAYLFDLVELGQRNASVPGIGLIRGSRLGELLASLMGEDSGNLPESLRRGADRDQALRILRQAIQKEKESYWQEPGKHIYLTWAREEKIGPLQNNDNLREQSFAFYLSAVAQKLEASV